MKKEHDDLVLNICEQVATQYKNKSTPLTLDVPVSNTTRAPDYKKGAKPLGIKNLNRVIAVHTDKLTALVEPRVTMEQLHVEVSKYGLCVPVLPEFKSITVGGAIMGAAIESSSFAHGQFNDICTGYEVIIGDGTKLWVSPQEHADLFYALPGSYGSLGIITLAEIKLLPASETMRVHYRTFSSIQDGVKELISRQSVSGVDFLEAIIFSKNEMVLIEGTRTASQNDTLPHFSMKYPWHEWFYQHVQKVPPDELLSLKDYLFRHDRGAFWMGAYAANLPLLLRYVKEGFLGFNSNRSTFMAKMGNPGFLFRMLLGWMMPSQRLYSLMHAGTEGWFAERFIIQDFYIPESKAVEFIDYSLEGNGITPIWLCPVKASRERQLFSPHSVEGKTENFIDIGIYGLPTSPMPVRELERMTQQLGGRKMLYSHSYYSEAEFWNIYSEKEYRDLRKKYFADGQWLDITKKTLNDL